MAEGVNVNGIDQLVGELARLDDVEFVTVLERAPAADDEPAARPGTAP